MINQMKGVPGVVPERFRDAMTIKHCALSLVGEPIMYPHINRLIELLHNHEISSFLVTNAQFPQQLESLRPVTQLYLSIDAASEESLKKKIDRPIFQDFWQRYLQCIDILSKKKQRTVFRLTLVKQHNMEEVDGYAQLVKRGMPHFIEVKGVTYSGDSAANFLTIKNTPFHKEVLTFCYDLVKSCNQILGQDLYEVACEHEHSLCVLIANKQMFKIEGIWWTWIDYSKFHSLIKSGKEFTAQEYIAPTPGWAIVGANEHGFDPEETRFKRLKGKPPTTGC